MSTIYGTSSDDKLDGTQYPALTIIDAGAGDDYIIVGNFQSAVGGPGNDTFFGDLKSTGAGAAYWSSPKGITVNFTESST
jgi:Ca2+-binding RTX toxin-like protein